MKKIVLSLVSATMLAFGVSAQTDEKTGYLPEKGDFAVGIDVIPLFRTIGGAFNNQSSVPMGGTAFSYDEQYLKPNVSVMGKYMLTDKWALKFNVGLALNHADNKGYVRDDRAFQLNQISEAKVADTEEVTKFGGSLMLGGEYHLGSRRVQGIFGFGLLLGASSYNANYRYGNNITELNQNPTCYFAPQTGVDLPAGYRVTSLNSNGPNVNLGVYGSTGFEWFVAPKIALGGEVDLYLYGCFSGKSSVKSEGFNQAYQRVDSHSDLYKPGNNRISFGTDNLGGQLYLSFYF